MPFQDTWALYRAQFGASRARRDCATDGLHKTLTTSPMLTVRLEPACYWKWLAPAHISRVSYRPSLQGLP